MNKINGLFTVTALFAAASPALAQESHVGAVEGVELCVGIMAEPDMARDGLTAAGWIARQPEADGTGAVYNEPEAGFFRRQSRTLIYASANTSLGRENPGFTGSCQLIFEGNSLQNATAFAAHAQTRAERYEARGRDVAHRLFFRHNGYTVEFASVGEDTDLDPESAATRIQVNPERE